MRRKCMRTAFLNLFRKSPFDGLLRHADRITEVAPIFQSALLSYLDDDMDEFLLCHNQVTVIESQGDAIKRNIRGHLPRNILLPVEKFQLLWFLREQDKVLDSVQDALHWISYRETCIPEEMVDDILLMVEMITEVLKSIHPLVSASNDYFQSFSENDRERVKRAISQIREYEFQSDQVERKLLQDLFSYPFEDCSSTFHLVRMVEYMGDVSDHAENAGDMMRAMIAR
jgi:predicted phosphate transport protein (TIGR00153 family)